MNLQPKLRSTLRIELMIVLFISPCLKYIEMIPLSRNLGPIFEIYNDFGRKKPKIFCKFKFRPLQSK